MERTRSKKEEKWVAMNPTRGRRCTRAARRRWEEEREKKQRQRAKRAEKWPAEVAARKEAEAKPWLRRRWR